MNNTRPPKTYETGPVTVWLRRIAVFASIVLTAVVLARFPGLPETIPTHFSWSGDADEWGPRWMVFPLIAIFVGLAWATAWISTRPQVFNYPMEITESNAQSAYREGERMMVWTSLSIVVLYAGAAAATFGRNAWLLLVVGLGGMLAAVIAGIVRLVAAR